DPGVDLLELEGDRLVLGPRPDRRDARMLVEGDEQPGDDARGGEGAEHGQPLDRRPLVARHQLEEDRRPQGDDEHHREPGDVVAHRTNTARTTTKAPAATSMPVA